ncbi:MAG: hypothetical protein MK183_06480 [Verrucomicrobiales bacterium]|nr:hypothetical protein [Verrucomicrobiales bacterium]MED5586854.1 hypothetical protein [Verrucomicrobiota bacterium]
MDGWINFWGALLVVTLLFYSLMVLYVSIGGFRDIRQMFRTLSGDGENKPEREGDDEAH